MAGPRSGDGTIQPQREEDLSRLVQTHFEERHHVRQDDGARFDAAATLTTALILALSVSSVARAQLVLSLTSAGAGSVTIPPGYDWTNVTVQCWGGGGGGGGGSATTTITAAALGGGAGGGGAYSSNTYTTPLSPGHIATISVPAAWRQRPRHQAAPAEIHFGTTAGLKTLLPAAAAGAAVGHTGGSGGAGGTVGAGTGYSGGGGGSWGSYYPAWPVTAAAAAAAALAVQAEQGPRRKWDGHGGSGGWLRPRRQRRCTGLWECRLQRWFPGGGGGGGGAGEGGGQAANGEIIVTYTPVYSGQVAWSASGGGPGAR